MSLTFIPEALPGRKPSAKASEYADTLREFLDAGIESARIEANGKKPASLVAGLNGAAADGKLAVKAHNRGGSVYLVRVEECE